MFSACAEDVLRNRIYNGLENRISCAGWGAHKGGSNMWEKKDRKRFLVVSCLTILVSLLVTACGSSVPLVEVEAGVPTVDTSEVAELVLAEVEAQLAEQGETVPVVYEDGAVDTAGGNLEDSLIGLYEQANVAVVTINVSSTASGSGFVYDEAGIIITNDHVADAGRSYEVIFANGERQRAELVGADADGDLAVLQVDRLPDGVDPLPLAEADDVQVGQFVVAIGSPFGEQGSMSLGIVSGLGRSLPSQRGTTSGSTYSLPQVIQTDAPINPGNSGGPLLNLDGEVVGVNAAIASTTGANSGVGFAIPVAAVRQIVPGLIERGEYVYPYMGVSFDDQVSLDEQSIYGVPSEWPF